MTVSVLAVFLPVPWVGLQSVIVAFPGHTHFLFFIICNSNSTFYTSHQEGKCSVKSCAYRMCGTVDVLKFRTFFSFYSTKLLVFRAETHKMHVRITNREDPDQTASEEAV